VCRRRLGKSRSTLEKLNRDAEVLNAEMEDVWEYQAVEELSTRIPSPRE
jgi:hypothetical protein